MNDPLGWAPIGQLVGLDIQPPREEGRAEVFLDLQACHHNPMGMVHGGVISLLADAAMGIAFGRTLVNQHGFATIEMKTNFVRPVKAGRLRAQAEVIVRGLRIGFCECRITDQRQRLIATASCTCSVT
ncbi:MAG: PaaI family thioesterase [Pirellulales bacterium]